MNRIAHALILLIVGFGIGKIHGTKAWDLICEGTMPTLETVWASPQQPVAEALPVPMTMEIVAGNVRTEQQIQTQYRAGGGSNIMNPLRPW